MRKLIRKVPDAALLAFDVFSFETFDVALPNGRGTRKLNVPYYNSGVCDRLGSAAERPASCHVSHVTWYIPAWSGLINGEQGQLSAANDGSSNHDQMCAISAANGSAVVQKRSMHQLASHRCCTTNPPLSALSCACLGSAGL